MTTEPLLEAIEVSKEYGGVQALDSVSLAILPGQVLALLGENGAGKSTLTKVIAGLVQPSSGTVRVDGQDVVLANAAQAHVHGIRAVAQELTLCVDLTVAENIGIERLPTKRRIVVDREAMATEARRRLALLGVEMDVHARVRDLSLPQRSFVQIARSLDRDTRVLILDEPTAPLAGAEVDQVLRAVRALADGGVGVVYISHRLDEVYRVADSMVVLRDGRRVAAFSGADVDKEQLLEAMLGDKAFDRATVATTPGEETVLSVQGLRGAGIEELNLDVRAGEIVGVYGVLGSGREVVAPAIAAAVRTDAGAVSVNGQTADMRKGVRGSRAVGVGYIPAERRSQGLVLHQSVSFNLTLGILRRLSSRGVVDRRGEREVVERWIEELGIKGVPDMPVGSLSGGNQQKVLVGRWLAAGSSALVLDEPTRGVDVGAKADMYATLRRQAERGAAVLVCTSDIEEVANISDRVLVMKHGRVVAELTEPTQQAVAMAALA